EITGGPPVRRKDGERTQQPREAAPRRTVQLRVVREGVTREASACREARLRSAARVPDERGETRVRIGSPNRLAGAAQVFRALQRRAARAVRQVPVRVLVEPLELEVIDGDGRRAAHPGV